MPIRSTEFPPLFRAWKQNRDLFPSCYAYFSIKDSLEGEANRFPFERFQVDEVADSMS